MAKKDFSKVNTGGVYETIAAATSETEQTHDAQITTKNSKAQTAQITRDIQDTQSGKLQRINMAFADDVYAYIKCMARVSGITMTDFCNIALRQHMEDHNDLYQRAIEFRNSL